MVEWELQLILRKQSWKWDTQLIGTGRIRIICSWELQVICTLEQQLMKGGFAIFEVWRLAMGAEVDMQLGAGA